MPRNLPAVVGEDLTPKQREAVRYYTDPLLPTFGNAAKAGIQAGYEDGGWMRSDVVKHAIQRIEEERAMAGAKVRDYLGRHAQDAALELVQQLSAGRELEVIPVADLFDDGQETMTKDRERRVLAATKHNRVAIQAAKQRKDAAELILRYHLGHPEQRVRHTGEDGVKMLKDMTDDELTELGKVLDELKKGGQPLKADPHDEAGVEDVDYEVVDDD